MAKDPAFLFYPGDYISGTMYLDFECKGAYMDLLMLQFQKDHMTIHMIKQVLGHKFDHIWSLINDKFQEKDGKYWNERLRVEKENRINFCKSRKKNRESTKHMKDHMSSHMEDENINKDLVLRTSNTVETVEVKKSQFPKPEDFNGLPEIKIGSAIQLIATTARVDIDSTDVTGLWGVFKDQNLTGKKFYQDEAAVYSHFLNWIRTQPFKDKPKRTSQDDKLNEARRTFKPIQDQ